MNDLQLIEAVKTGELAIVEELIESGADINQQDEQRWTPLNWAAGKGDVAIVKLLLERGADVFKTGRDQRAPYMIALAASRVEAAKLLREAEERAGGENTRSRQERKYCKAYHLKELRRFPHWTESKIYWKETNQNPHVDGSENDDKAFSDDDIAFLHQDFTVTQSMWHNENVLLNQVTQEWEKFCTEVLKFQVPDDFDLIPSVHNATHDESS